jgi:hypothetical protein
MSFEMGLITARLVITGWIVGSLLALTGEFVVSINYDW